MRSPWNLWGTVIYSDWATLLFLLPVTNILAQKWCTHVLHLLWLLWHCLQLQLQIYWSLSQQDHICGGGESHKDMSHKNMQKTDSWLSSLLCWMWIPYLWWLLAKVTNGRNHIIWTCASWTFVNFSTWYIHFAHVLKFLSLIHAAASPNRPCKSSCHPFPLLPLRTT